MSTGSLLKLQAEAGGLRYWLGDRPLHAGVQLDMRLHDGTWLRGRYEYNHKPGSITAYFCFAVWDAGRVEHDDAGRTVPDCGEATIVIDPAIDQFRWPDVGMEPSDLTHVGRPRFRKSK